MLILRLHKKYEKQFLGGCPWVSASMLVESSDQALAAPGELAELRTERDQFLGLGYYNQRSQIAFRLLSPRREPVDEAFLRRRIEAALHKREALFSEPYYRLVHAEADGLPGLTADCFGDVLVLQISTAGMERLKPQLLHALESVLAPRAIVLRNDIPARAKEGLAQEVTVIKGEIPPLTQVLENGCIYLADLLHGQKTGWFYDQRGNRAMAAVHASGVHVLDMYSHSGGFGLLAARAGAASVTFADSSALALELGAKAAAVNGVADVCRFTQGDAFALMQRFAQSGQRFGLAVADPPAFVKSREHLASGLKGYEKVARLASSLVEPGGVLVVASCSHHASRPRFRQAVLAGAAQAGRRAEVLAYPGASADHPLHPHLPQSEYLKALFLRLA